MDEICGMWMSTRAIRRSGDTDWDDFFRYKGMPHVREVRSIDSWLNPCVEGHYVAGSLDIMWEMLDLLLKPPRAGEYHLMFMDALAGDLPEHPRLKLLGYDLSDETWTSSLLNCVTGWANWSRLPRGQARTGCCLTWKTPSWRRRCCRKCGPATRTASLRSGRFFEILPKL